MSLFQNTTALLYGKGVFTTLFIHDGQPFVWEKHWRRLVRDADILGIDLSDHSEKRTHGALVAAIQEGGGATSRARITFSDESPSGIWSAESERRTSLSIIVGERRQVPATFELTVSPHRVNTTSPLAGVKSCNYLEPLLAYREATRRGFHEAVRANEDGKVASACIANIYWERDGKLLTPSLKTGCLPGTTREYLLENVRCEEVEAEIEELEKADRIFLTSAGIGVVSVAEFGGRQLNTSEHQLLKLIPNRY